jgi:putative endonuclease
MLVWYEYRGSMEHAIWREKDIKEWKRAWSITLIEDTNPHWLDLFEQEKNHTTAKLVLDGPRGLC